jgi:hypothetical protein
VLPALWIQILVVFVHEVNVAFCSMFICYESFILYEFCYVPNPQILETVAHLGNKYKCFVIIGNFSVVILMLRFLHFWQCKDVHKVQYGQFVSISNELGESGNVTYWTWSAFRENSVGCVMVLNKLGNWTHSLTFLAHLLTRVQLARSVPHLYEFHFTKKIFFRSTGVYCVDSSL